MRSGWSRGQNRVSRRHCGRAPPLAGALPPQIGRTGGTDTACAKQVRTGRIGRARAIGVVRWAGIGQTWDLQPAPARRTHLLRQVRLGHGVGFDLVRSGRK